MTKHKTIADEWKDMEADRQAALSRKRVHASLTMPWLLPPEGKAQNQALDIPYSSLPSEGASALASQIVSVVFPLNNQPVFELMTQDVIQPEGNAEEVGQMREVLSRFERGTMDELAPTNLRSSTHLVYLHLICIGDCLHFQRDDGDFRVFRLDQYVVKRKHEGEWQKIIINEMIDPELYPDLAGVDGEQAHVTATISPLDHHREPLFTRIERMEDGTFEWKQEFRGKIVEEGKYEVCPYSPLRWAVVAGEDYGVSLVEMAFGDIRALDALTRALIDGALLNSEHRMGVNPSGLTEIQDLLDSTNGDYVPAVPGEVFPIQFQNHSQVQAVHTAVNTLKQELGRRFLMFSASQPEGERVTARHVALIAQELEKGLGGILSQAARDVQIPVIRYKLFRMAEEGRIPTALKEHITSEKVLKIRVRAGLEILNREAEREKIDGAIERVRNLPDQAQAVFKWEQIARDWWNSMGLDPDGRIKSTEEMEAERQAAQQAAQAQMLQQGAVQAGVAAAGQQPPQE